MNESRLPWLNAQVVLDDGSVWKGFSPSPPGVYPVSEFVFNTANAGYEEVMTDPSYGGQVVVFTTPHLGTTGWTHLEGESAQIAAAGVICRDLVTHHDNHLAKERLCDVLVRQQVPVVTHVDTRALTLKIREHGSMQGCIVVHAAESPCHPDVGSMGLPDLQEPLALRPCAAVPDGSIFFAPSASNAPGAPHLKVAVIDFGVKTSILKCLTERGAEVLCLAWDTVTLEQVVAAGVDGVLFSNGAGDPRCLLQEPQRLELYRKLAEGWVSRGICFGHQALALAYGSRVIKLAFGHHAINHPVASLGRDGVPDAVSITSQNHNYAVSPEGLPPELHISHIHLNDGTIAGLRHTRVPFESVQFHPEAGPGPRDARSFFDAFFVAMKEKTSC